MPVSKRGRPRDQRAHAAILSAATALLAEVGFDRMSMEAIAGRAKVSKQTLYRWWPSKNAVIADALLSGFIAIPDNPLPQSSDVWLDLDTWLTTAAASIRGPYGAVLRAATAIQATDPELARSLSQAFAAPVREALQYRLQRAVSDGNIRPDASLTGIASTIMAVIVYVGLAAEEAAPLASVLDVIRRGAQ